MNTRKNDNKDEDVFEPESAQGSRKSKGVVQLR